MHLDILWRTDSDLDLIALCSQHRDCNFRPNQERLADPPGQNQHQRLPNSSVSPPGWRILGWTAREGTYADSKDVQRVSEGAPSGKSARNGRQYRPVQEKTHSPEAVNARALRRLNDDQNRLDPSQTTEPGFLFLISPA
jgi:hypothetical protein